MGVQRVVYSAASIAWMLGLGLLSPGLDIHAQEASSSETKPKTRELTTVGENKLRIGKAVACRSIEGYERYVPLRNGAITAEEKLQIYYRVLRCKFAVQGHEYLVHLIQDGQIRRKGDKNVLRAKKNILNYEARTTNPPDWIFLRNSVPLKGLIPGEYEYDIILRDEYNPGPPVIQTVRFRVVPPGTIPPDPSKKADRSGGEGTGKTKPNGEAGAKRQKTN